MTLPFFSKVSNFLTLSVIKRGVSGFTYTLHIYKIIKKFCLSVLTYFVIKGYTFAYTFTLNNNNNNNNKIIINKGYIGVYIGRIYTYIISRVIFSKKKCKNVRHEN